MAKRMAAEITIGGTIPASLVPELCRTITEEGVSHAWGDAPLRPLSAADLLETLSDGLLWLCDDQASWGQFDALERLLQEHNVPFDRKSGGKYEYDAEMVHYRPHLPELLRVITDANGEPVVSASKLKPVDEALSRAQSEPTRSGILEAVRAAQQLLQLALPPSLEPMEPFRISGS